MSDAVAFSNNDIALIAWRYPEPIDDCLGFAVYRRSSSQPAATPLPAWVGFEGESNDDWQPSTTEHWPIQRFNWRDLTAAAGGTYVYDIVPMIGDPGDLKPRQDLRLTTGPVTLTPARSEHVSAYFNRGILSTQHLVHSLPQGPKGGPSSVELINHIKKPGDPLRASLAGQIIEALSALVIRATQEGGRVNCALYELNDPELVALLDTPSRVELLLANAGEGDDHDNTNRDARKRLHEDGVDVTDRMLGSTHIGHDKFVVYSDPTGKPAAVMTGSTNWTYTGLCAQANNALIVEDDGMAALYLDFWHRLQDESPAGAPATQSNALRTTNNRGHDFVIDGAPTTIWFSPNTEKHTKPPDNQPEPDDMADVFEHIRKAKEGILFLLFQPGAPSVLKAVVDAQRETPGLYVRGAATDPGAINDYTTELHKEAGKAVSHVAAASAVDDQFAYWQKELLKTPGGHAIVHDKIVVIDPLSPECVVVTGSHNLGYSASFKNDENLVIIRGHRALAEAYAVHVMDVYDHYRWRWHLDHHGDDAFKGLKKDPKVWQGWYFDESGTPEAEIDFWVSGGAR